MDRGDQAQLLERIIAWSKAQAGIRAVALVGSGARQDHPADEWSDIDLVLVSGDPQAYLASTDWLTDLGEPWFMFLERNSAGEAFVRRVLFAGGLDVDFVIFSTESARQGFSGTFLPEIALRDMQVLLDKDGILSSLPGDVSPLLVDSHPTVADFTEVVNDFWFHAVWTAKKLKRGELWTAKSCCDVYMKRLLLRMLEWHAHATREVDTWYDGRFLEQWASPVVLEKLRIAFAHYDVQDIWRALRASMELFDQVARETARRWGYAYPDENAEKVLAWVGACQPRQP
jgi:aminoglycoside 6-adenylyltransferase